MTKIGFPGRSKILLQHGPLASPRAPLPHLRLDPLLHRTSRRRNSHGHPLLRPLLGPLVLARGLTHRLLNRRLRLPHDDVILPLRFIMGPMDLRVRAELYGYIECVAVFLRHVWAV